MTNLARRELAALLSVQRLDQYFQIVRFIFPTSPHLGFRTEPGHNFGMSFACFRVCYLRKIQLQPIQNCLPEHFSQVVIACGFNNRKAEINLKRRGGGRLAVK
jgi:hypothetical protein